MSANKIEIYLLDVRSPNSDPRRYQVASVLTLGSDSACDICVKDFGLSPLHGRFRFQNGILTFTNLGLADSCLVGSQKCGQGKMYILDKGDKFTCGEIKIIVRREKVDVEDLPSTPTKTPATEDSVVDPSAPLGSYSEEVEDEYEEVEVYIDEDGNEVEAPKKLGFFARRRLKREQKKIEKEKQKALKNKSVKAKAGPGLVLTKNRLKTPTAGIITRFLGIIFDVVFFILISKLVLPQLKKEFDIDLPAMVETLTQDLQPLLIKGLSSLESIPQLTPHFSTYPEIKAFLLDQAILEVVILFLIYDIFFNLIFGVGLGSFLIGMKTQGSIIFTRLLSPIRVVIGWLTLPLLIFDLPVLLRKATVKELLTMTRVVNRSIYFNVSSAFVFMPILIFLIGNYNLLPLVLKLPNMITHNEIELKANKGSFKEVPFYLRSYGFKKEGKSFWLPKLEMIPTLPPGNVAKDSPLIIIDPDKNQKVILHVQKPLISYKEIFSILARDPTFSTRYQGLIKAINMPKTKKNAAQDPTFGEDQAQKLISALYEIFAIDFKNPVRGVRMLGPFLGPYYEFRKTVLEKLSLQEIKAVILVESPNAKYLKLLPKNNDEVSFLVATSQDGLEYMEIESDQKSTRLTDKLLERIIVHPRELERDYATLMPALKKDQEPFNRGFMAHSILTRVCEKEKIRNSEVKFLSDYFMTMAQKATKTENESFQSLLIRNMEVLDKALLRLKKRNKDEALSELRLSLLRIQKALFQRDAKFFKANER